MRPLVRTVSVIIWALAVLLGSGGMWYYATRAGAPAAAAPGHWPAGTALHLDPRRPTLVVALHPQCPCSRATVEQLARLVSDAGNELAPVVLVSLPPGAPSDWADAPLVRAVREIPNVTTVIDPGGAESARFGALTSGQAYLYDPDGRLTFAGGITAARGHAGDNLGSDTVLAAAHHPAGATAAASTNTMTTTPVYGCPLFGSCPAPTAKEPQ